MNKEEFDTLLEKGQNLSFQGQNKEALHIFEDLLQRPINDEQRIILYYELGWCFMQQGNDSAAEVVFQKQHNEAKFQNNKWGLGAALNGLGLLLLRRGHLKDALAKLKESLTIRIEIDNKKEIAGAHNNISIVYLARGQISQALEFLQKNLEIHMELNNTPGIHSAYLNLGVVARLEEDYEKSFDYFKRVLDEGTEKVFLPIYLRILHNQALVWQAMKKWEEMIQCFEEAIDLAKENNVKGEVYALLLIGLAEEMAKRKPSESIKLLFEAEEVIRDEKSETGKISCALGFANVEKEMKNWKEAERRYIEVLKQAEDKQFLDGVLAAYINLAELALLHFKHTRETNLLRKMDNQLEEMFILAEEEELFVLKVLILELQSYLLFFERQFDTALQLVTQAQEIIIENSLHKYESQIKNHQRELQDRIKLNKTEQLVPKINENDIKAMLEIFLEFKKYW
ncbi:MAG: tetratricopeptide repeat protein [Candidatus Hermodarchaeota archaeon]